MATQSPRIVNAHVLNGDQILVELEDVTLAFSVDQLLTLKPLAISDSSDDGGPSHPGGTLRSVE